MIGLRLGYDLRGKDIAFFNSNQIFLTLFFDTSKWGYRFLYNKR